MPILVQYEPEAAVLAEAAAAGGREELARYMDELAFRQAQLAEQRAERLQRGALALRELQVREQARLDQLAAEQQLAATRFAEAERTRQARREEMLFGEQANIIRQQMEAEQVQRLERLRFGFREEERQEAEQQQLDVQFGEIQGLAQQYLDDPQLHPSVRKSIDQGLNQIIQLENQLQNADITSERYLNQRRMIQSGLSRLLSIPGILPPLVSPKDRAQQGLIMEDENQWLFVKPDGTPMAIKKDRALDIITQKGQDAKDIADKKIVAEKEQHIRNRNEKLVDMAVDRQLEQWKTLTQEYFKLVGNFMKPTVAGPGLSIEEARNKASSAMGGFNPWTGFQQLPSAPQRQAPVAPGARAPVAPEQAPATQAPATQAPATQAPVDPRAQLLEEANIYLNRLIKEGTREDYARARVYDWIKREVIRRGIR
jgi:hypothetical protein